MNQRVLAAVGSLFLVVLVAAATASAAESGDDPRHPVAASAPTAAMSPSGTAPAMPDMERMKMLGQGAGMTEMMKMMGSGHPMMPPRHGKEVASPSAGLRMMDEALSGRMMMEPGMMRRMMDQAFYLDRADELGLSADQVAKLRDIRSACRRDNIRTGGEVRIARLDLDDLLSRDDWSLAEAEKLVRQQQKLEGDLLIRHLQALAAARQVLTAEQLRAAGGDGQTRGLPDLFH